jgi:hypothetical protein
LVLPSIYPVSSALTRAFTLDRIRKTGARLHGTEL